MDRWKKPRRRDFEIEADGIASNRVEHAIIDFILSRRDRSVQEIGENVPFPPPPLPFLDRDRESSILVVGYRPSSAVTPDDPSIRNLTRYRGNTRWRRTCRYRYYRCHYAPSSSPPTRYCYSGRYFDSHARTPVFLSPLNARIHFAAANGEKWHRICTFFASRSKRRTCFFETGKLNFSFFLFFFLSFPYTAYKGT